MKPIHLLYVSDHSNIMPMLMLTVGSVFSFKCYKIYFKLSKGHFISLRYMIKKLVMFSLDLFSDIIFSKVRFMFTMVFQFYYGYTMTLAFIVVKCRHKIILSFYVHKLFHLNNLFIPAAPRTPADNKTKYFQVTLAGTPETFKPLCTRCLLWAVSATVTKTYSSLFSIYTNPLIKSSLWK